ncbi:MoxR-like ATPase [Actinomycetota bacterium]|nr:MoxR-like ATPase [Actinomycetota bacterium]
MKINEKDIEWYANVHAQLVNNIEQQFIGKPFVVQLVLSAMIAKGHVLLEDVPGTGKTHLARVLAKSIDGQNSRIQFTPDLLPSDITGVNIYDSAKKEFIFHQGPIFANIVLGDEINRASPKTQSAMLEVMEEGSVTTDGVTREVDKPFLVIATQNPVEQAGTYALPEAQLDRFLIKASIGYTDHSTSVSIINGSLKAKKITNVAKLEDVVKMQKIAAEVFLDPAVSDYIVQLVEATRLATQVRIGSSIRGAIALANISKAWAAGNGRHFVIPDDVKALAVPVLAHRLILEPEAIFDGVESEAIINQILIDTPVPTGA